MQHTSLQKKEEKLISSQGPISGCIRSYAALAEKSAGAVSQCALPDSTLMWGALGRFDSPRKAGSLKKSLQAAGDMG